MRNRQRALRKGAALFLHERAADEIEERLSEVNRQFTKPAVVTGFPDFWAARFPGARIVPDDGVLGLRAGAHDLVIHALALHWANDPVGQLVQCRHALIPDGLFLAATVGGRALSELRAVLAEAEAAVTGGLSARVLPMGEIRDLGALLQRAGFALPVADTAPLEVLYATVVDLIAELRAMGEGNALAGRSRDPGSMRRILPEAARFYAEAFPAEGGRIRATMETIYLTGWAPSATQQKPLRPGSAARRLADALSTEETALPDHAPLRRD